MLGDSLSDHAGLDMVSHAGKPFFLHRGGQFPLPGGDGGFHVVVSEMVSRKSGTGIELFA